jgi:putative peptidoglycan binding protein/D-alanyl-D-alanine carboxypeptidase-like protein
MASNGRLPASSLAPIAGGRLIRPAAAAFNAMNAESQRRFGVTLRPTGPVSSYRPISAQWYFWNLYRSGRGNLAAYPGTSNHGWGLAVDFASPQMRAIVDRIGAKYGWAKRWSDAPSEWWHIRWRSGVWHGRVPPPAHRTLRRGSRGRDVGRLQWRLRQLGHKRVPAKGKRGRRYFGASTVRAVKTFQKNHHLKPDGVVGPATWTRLFH